jgi:hypothetical protein
LGVFIAASTLLPAYSYVTFQRLAVDYHDRQPAPWKSGTIPEISLAFDQRTHLESTRTSQFLLHRRISLFFCLKLTFLLDTTTRHIYVHSSCKGWFVGFLSSVRRFFGKLTFG